MSDTHVGSHTQSSSKVTKQSTEDARQPHVLVVQSGLIPDETVPTMPSGGRWNVRAANFSFAVSCKVAITKATIITGSVTTELDEEEPTSVVEGTGNPIWARPMCDTNQITSEVSIRISPDAPAQPMLTVGEELFAAEPVWNNNTSIVKSLPNGLWGKCKSSREQFAPYLKLTILFR